MSQIINVKLTDQACAALERQAQAAGTSPSDEAAASLERRFGGCASPRGEEEKQTARARFELHFGEIDLGYPTGTDNKGIDADLAREYISPHEEI